MLKGAGTRCGPRQHIGVVATETNASGRRVVRAALGRVRATEAKADYVLVVLVIIITIAIIIKQLYSVRVFSYIRPSYCIK